MSRDMREFIENKNTKIYVVCVKNISSFRSLSNPSRRPSLHDQFSETNIVGVEFKTAPNDGRRSSLQPPAHILVCSRIVSGREVVGDAGIESNMQVKRKYQSQQAV